MFLVGLLVPFLFFSVVFFVCLSHLSFLRFVGLLDIFIFGFFFWLVELLVALICSSASFIFGLNNSLYTC